MPTQQIDEGDPQVQYSPGWSQDGTPGSFHNSLHGSATPGSTATLTFTGTGVEVHGIVRNTKQHPTMKFTVDGGSTSTYTAPTVGNQNAMVFFSTSGLSSDQHRLVITNQDGGGPIALWLDFFVVTSPQGPPPGGPPPASSPTHRDPPTSPNSPNTPTLTPTSASTSQDNPAPTTTSADPPATSSHTSSAPNANSTQSLPASISSKSSSDSDSDSATASGSGSATASSKPSQSTGSPDSGSSTSYSPLPDNASSTTPKAFASPTSTSSADPFNPAVTDTAHAASRPNVGAIVGGVVGALLLLLLLVLALFLYRRRLKKRAPTFIYPFTMDQPHNRDDMSEVGTVATTAEGILTTWAPDMFQVQSGSTVNLAPGPQASLPRPAPVDIPTDVSPYSPSVEGASYLTSSKPLVHQSMGSVDVVDVSFVRSPVSPGFEQLSPVGSRGSWPAI